MSEGRGNNLHFVVYPVVQQERKCTKTMSLRGHKDIENKRRSTGIGHMLVVFSFTDDENDK